MKKRIFLISCIFDFSPFHRSDIDTTSLALVLDNLKQCLLHSSFMKSLLLLVGGFLIGYFLASILFLYSISGEIQPKMTPKASPTITSVSNPGSAQDTQRAFEQLFNLTEKMLNSFNDMNKKNVQAAASSISTSSKQKIRSNKDKLNSNKFMETIQAERRTTLKEACRRLRDKNVCPSEINGINNRLLYSKRYKMMACDIPKCGYTSWLEGFFAIEGKQEEYLDLIKHKKSIIPRSEQLFRLNVIIKNATLKKNVFDNSLKVILVRHPFSRLVSAYYDKMVPTSEGYTYIYGPMSQVIYRNYRHLRLNVAARRGPKNGSASFEDFVNFLVRLKQFDDHWKPFHDLCHPCSSQYDYIAKFETIKEDMKYLKDKINLTEEHLDMFFSRLRNYHSTFDLMKKTFANVSRKLVHRLYGLYKDDFELFGYSLPPWMC